MVHEHSLRRAGCTACCFDDKVDAGALYRVSVSQLCDSERAYPVAQRGQFDAQLQKHREFRAAFRRHYREKKAVIEQLQTRLRQSARLNEQLRQENEELRSAAGRVSEAGSPATVVESPPAVPGPTNAVAHASYAAGGAKLQTRHSTDCRALQMVHQQAASAGNAEPVREVHDALRPLADGRLAAGSQGRDGGQSSLRAVDPSTTLPPIDGLRLAHNEDFNVLPASLPSSQDLQPYAAARPVSHGVSSDAEGRHEVALRGSLVSVSNRGGRVAAEEGRRPMSGPIRRHAEQPGAAEAQSSKGWKRKRGGGDNFMPDVLAPALRTKPPLVNADDAGDQPMASPHLPAVTSIPETPRASPDAGNHEDYEGRFRLSACCLRCAARPDSIGAHDVCSCLLEPA